MNGEFHSKQMAHRQRAVRAAAWETRGKDIVMTAEGCMMESDDRITKRILFGLVCALFVLMNCGSPAWGVLRSVAPDHPQANDEGEGTPDGPYRTLAYAMTRLMPGDTLMVSAGTYREALIFPDRAWSVNTPTSIIGAGKVTLIGTDIVGGWAQKGNDVFVKRPWLQEPQQVVVNGVLLKQVGGTIFNGYPGRAGHELAQLHRSEGGIWPKRMAGGLKNMPPDSFFYDASRQELLIKKNIAAVPDNAVEVSTRTYLVQGRNIAGITIKGIRFRYSTTSTISRQGAVTLTGRGNTLDSITVEDADGAGIEVSGDDNTVINCVVTRSGYLGIKARGKNNLLSGNQVSYNNTRGFNKWWEAGGMKFIGDYGLQHSRVVGNQVTHNYGDGIWFDWGNDDNRVERNVVAYNHGFGIHYEASSRAFIADNQVFANHQRGIYLPHSRDSVVAHNLVIANELEGVTVIDELRDDSAGKLDLRPRNNKILANVVAWNKGLAVILPGSQFGNVSDANLFIQQSNTPYFSMGWPKGWTSRKNLGQWRSLEAQDRKSVAVKASMDVRIKDALAREDVTIDWSGLASFQAMISVSDEMLGIVALSRKKSYAKAGPR